MPIYEYRCRDCGEITSLLWRSDTTREEMVCRACGEQNLVKVISKVSVHRNTSSKLDSLDPRYDKMLDKAARSNPLSDPNAHLSRMRPFKNKKPLTE